MKTGLTLEGGAMRGMFTAGVLDVMMEQGITFDGCAGVSAGAVFGCNLKSRQIGRAIRYNVRFAGDPRYCSVRSLIRTGDMYGAKFCYETLPFSLDIFDIETFRKNPMKFYAVATDIVTGKAVYKEIREGTGEDMDWLRASASMPLVSRPVKIGDGYYLDGGVADSIPLAFMMRAGYEKNVVVLTQPKEYRKHKSSVGALCRVFLHRYPALARGMKERHEMYNRELDFLARKEAAGEAFVIRPPHKLEISRTESDPEKLKAVYRIGRETMEGQLDAMRAYLGA